MIQDYLIHAYLDPGQWSDPADPSHNQLQKFVYFYSTVQYMERKILR